MQFRDRFARGFIAGMLSGMVVSIFSLSAYSWGLIGLRWLDFASVLTHGHRPTTTYEAFFAELVMYGWCGGLGVIAAYAIPVATSLNYRMKGVVGGLLVWFILYSVIALARVTTLTNLIDAPTTTAHALAGVVWGLLTVEILHWFDKRVVDAA